MIDKRQIGHAIASSVAMQIVKEGVAAGLDWTDIALLCESAIAIVVAAAAEMADRPNHLQFGTELIDTMTERAHERVAGLILARRDIRGIN